MVSVIELPSGMVPRHHTFRLDGSTASAGRGLDGRAQVLVSENRIWKARVTFPPMDRALAQRAETVGDQLFGRAGVLRLPVKNAVTPQYGGDLASFYRDLGISSADQLAGGLPFSDGTSYSDGTGYALPGAGEPVVGDAIEAGAVVLRLEGFIGRNLQPGAFFSINDFLYRVVDNEEGFVRFNPPLREAVEAGAGVCVSEPYVRLRLTTDDGWSLDVQYEVMSEELSVDFEEVFER